MLLFVPRSKLAARGNIPLARLGSSASVVNGQLIVFGGCIFGGDSNDVGATFSYSLQFFKAFCHRKNVH